jgi:hypothetical protein
LSDSQRQIRAELTDENERLLDHHGGFPLSARRVGCMTFINPDRGGEMKRIILAAVLSGYVTTAFAGGPSCKEQALEQTLAGSLLVSFRAQCERDALMACNAVRPGFTQKCVHRAVGMKSCTKLLRDSFRPQLLVRSLEADEETALLWCPEVCTSALPLASSCGDGTETIGTGVQRRADRE